MTLKQNISKITKYTTITILFIYLVVFSIFNNDVINIDLILGPEIKIRLFLIIFLCLIIGYFMNSIIKFIKTFKFKNIFKRKKKYQSKNF